MVGATTVEIKNKVYEFREGGRRFYAIVGQKDKHIGLFRNLSLLAKKQFQNVEYFFADKDENRELPGSEWDLNFSEQNGITTVHISIYNESKNEWIK